jgi:hypothetical protein
VLDEIEIDGEPVAPQAFFRTVRQRMGLDLSLLSARSSGLAAVGSRFAAEQGAELERTEAEVAAAIDDSAARLRARGVAVEANPLRNYSFQKRWFDWERRERWFGVQIYRSLRLTAIPGEPFAIGFWLFNNDCGGIERRIYAALKPEHSEAHGGAAEAVFRAVVPAHATTARTEQGHVQGLYACVDWDRERVAEVIAELAFALART